MNAMAEDAAAADLVAVAARAGDEVAFTRLVAAHHAEMLRVAHVITGDADVASDAAQRAWTSPGGSSPIFGSPSGSGRGSSRSPPTRPASGRHQRRRTVVEIAVGSDVDATGDPTAGISRLDLANALAGLKPEDRELVAMRFVAGFDSFEIAAARGGSASGTRARIGARAGTTAQGARP